ncbi:MAG: hypothetical protein KDJ36_10225 [Hyphomicrobiaceae bacterium]|nr:hypothetical protein [Hyphomicrobiaceae bacterium]
MTMKVFWSVAACAAVAIVAFASGPAEAGKRAKKPGYGGYYGGHPASRYYSRRGPQVRGYFARRGGYSYDPTDTINTYGDSRTRYGSTNAYRNHWVDRQTISGPFDHGFFFDSGIAPNGGNSPYLN